MEFSPKAGDFWHVWDPEWKILKDTPGAHSVFYESDMAGAKRDFVNWDYKKHGWKEQAYKFFSSRSILLKSLRKKE